MMMKQVLMNRPALRLVFIACSSRPSLDVETMAERPLESSRPLLSATRSLHATRRSTRPVAHGSSLVDSDSEYDYHF